MADTSFPPEFKQFLLEHIESYEDLEVLSWFQRQEEGSHSSVKEIGEGAGIPEQLARGAAVRLARSGLLSLTNEKSESFRYSPADADVRELAGRLVLEYRQNQLPVMALMTRNAIERVRNAALRTFADCFRVRGPKSDD